VALRAAHEVWEAVPASPRLPDPPAAVVSLLIAFTAGLVVGVALSEWRFTVNVRRAVALAAREG
jgi:hypothetical protein